MSASTAPIMELRAISKDFDGMSALSGVSLSVSPGEVICLLGDNGAGKSTLIKIMSGVHAPSSGEIRVDGRNVVLSSPRSAQKLGIATVYQETDTFPLMSIYRNFFLGHEPMKGWGPFRRIDRARAGDITIHQIRSIGIRRITNFDVPVGTMSGGERQALAVSRALYFGARLLILDEPTSALGIREAGIVLKLIQETKKQGIGVVFITHNAQHAIAVGDRFSILIQGSVAVEFDRGQRSREELIRLMAGGEELERLQATLEQRQPLNGLAIGAAP